jgi:hypothetical protein
MLSVSCDNTESWNFCPPESKRSVIIDPFGYCCLKFPFPRKGGVPSYAFSTEKWLTDVDKASADPTGKFKSLLDMFCCLWSGQQNPEPVDLGVSHQRLEWMSWGFPVPWTRPSIHEVDDFKVGKQEDLP